MNIEEAKGIINKNIYYNGIRADYIDINNVYDGERLNPCEDFIQAIETVLAELEKYKIYYEEQ